MAVRSFRINISNCVVSTRHYSFDGEGAHVVKQPRLSDKEESLFRALDRKDINNVRLLLDEGVNPNIIDDNPLLLFAFKRYDITY